MNIEKYCKSRNTNLLDEISSVAKEKLVISCAQVLFQGTGNKEIAMEILQHFGIISTFYNAEGQDIVRFTGNWPVKTLSEQLLFTGTVTFPVYQESELNNLETSFETACKSFPEYKRNRDGDILYVLGGFGAFGNPASFHNPFVRDVRRKANLAVRKKVFVELLKSYPDQEYVTKVRSQVLIDRMTFRPALQEPSAEAWHRDIVMKEVANVKPGDIIFGGWVNTSTHKQGFSFIPGSHLGVDLYSLKSGGFAEPGFIFDKDIVKVKKQIKSADDDAKEDLKDKLKALKEKRKQLYALFKQYKQLIVIPPGHAIIFPQYILHEIVSKGVKHDIMRVFMGYRLTQSRQLLFHDKGNKKPTLLRSLKNQSIMRLGGGMLPPMYSANHRLNFLRRPFYIFGSKNPEHGKKSSDPVKEDLIQWSTKTFKDVCLVDMPSKNDKPAYKIVSRYMQSLKEMKLPLYPAYTKEEIKIYYPQPLLKKKITKKKSTKKLRKSSRKKIGKSGAVKKKFTIVSWNVNSLRARILDKETGKCRLNPRPINPTSPLGELISSVNPDIICFQETKCTCATRQCFQPEGFYHFWNCASEHITWKNGVEKVKPVKGYSGVSIWSRVEPEKVTCDLPNLAKESSFLLKEGRILTAFFDKFILVTTYTPNTLRAGTKRKSGEFPNPSMMKHRLNWDTAVRRYIKRLEKEQPVVWCGDLNVAKGPMDIYKGEFSRHKLGKYGKAIFTNDEIVFEPREDLTKNEQKAAKKWQKRWLEGMIATFEGGGAGYRLQERESLNKVLQEGFVDAFRKKHPDEYGFTYWDLTRPAFRGVNYGLRLDYFIVSKRLLKKIKDVFVDPDVGVKENKVASDHAPVILQLEF